MPDWTAPFRMPHMTTEEFEKRKADYVAKYGYTIHIPGFDDIIKIQTEKPITPEETAIWKRRAYGEISPERYEQLKAMKEKRRQKYLNMLGDPSPEIFRSRASILTSIDNAQDALSTVTAVGMVAAKVAPRAASKIISGPIGWIMTAADCLNFAISALSPERAALGKKRLQDSMTTDNPFSKKARVKRAVKLRNAKVGKGAVIEALQTTEGIFGVGISLGALMNLPVAVVSGVARKITGAKVDVKFSVPSFAPWHRTIMKAGYSVFTRLSHRHGTDDEEITSLLIASNTSMQAQARVMEMWNPLDSIYNLDKVYLRAPVPESILALEVLDEEDPNWRESLVWPSTGEPQSNINALINSAVPIITENLSSYCERNKHNFMGLVGSMNASQSGMYAIEALEGEGVVEYDYTAWCKTIHAILDQGYVFPETITDDQKQCMVGWLDAHEEAGSCPTTPEVLDYVKHNCGWEFTREA